MKYINKFKLNNKIALIVGGGLIGGEVTKAFLEAGAKVILLDIDIKKNPNYPNKNFFFEKFDLTKINQIKTKINNLIKKYGAPDVFVNCSYPKTKDWASNSFSKINLNSFKKNIEIHLNSFSWTSKLIADLMVKYKKKGSIINLSSIYGVVGQDLNIYLGTNMKESMTYSVIKGGLNTLAKQMAAYYGKFEIRVNTICPGGVEDKKQPKKFKINYSKKNPIKRLAKPEEIATTILFLASDASSYITGSSLMVDGGWTAI